MLSFLTREDQITKRSEGDVFKIFNLYGRVFEIKYGYYEECDRHNPVVEPMPIYPDFINNPVYTAEGFPFVTKMQDVCQHYKGEDMKDNGCAECEYYRHGDELLGICICNENKNHNI